MRHIQAPPSSVTGPLGEWLQVLWKHIEAQPNISIQSFSGASTPNSLVTGLPGERRGFACERWLGADPALWSSLREQARAAARPPGSLSPILGFAVGPVAIELSHDLGSLLLATCQLGAIAL